MVELKSREVAYSGSVAEVDLALDSNDSALYLTAGLNLGGDFVTCLGLDVYLVSNAHLDHPLLYHLPS